MGRIPNEERPLSRKNEIVKDKIRDYLADCWEDLIADINELEPKDRVDRRLKLMEYVMPKVQATKGETEAKKRTAAQTVLSGKGDAQIADRLGVAAAVGHGTELFKIVKYVFRLQIR